MIRKNIGLSILLFVCLIIQAQDSPVAKKDLQHHIGRIETDADGGKR
jgi:hypothetical protein